ncbi:deoxynucleoside kinase [Nilaparvata lugens]|uniref:deoxynucleoside kinase n=1 Tax=Nilaparvata lugens TaxID=108931 RepID=UPI00193E189B|nr:deoxynucleoside kinase [Nilaparvata lugens]
MTFFNNVAYACRRLLRSKPVLFQQSCSRSTFQQTMDNMESTNKAVLSDEQFTIFVEGNIGSGKTSFLNQFFGNEAVICTEPMDLWRNLRGHNVLELMYDNPGRWSFTFQSLVQKTMLDLHLRASKNSIKLMERSIYSARYCFVEHLHKQGLMSAPEYAVLDEWFKWIITKCKINGNLLVYLRTEPEVVHQRIIARNRKEESGLALSYLQCLHDLHEDWLINRSSFSCPVPVVVLDANKPIPDVVEQFKQLQPDLVNRMHLKRNLNSTCSPSKAINGDSAADRSILKTIN